MDLSNNSRSHPQAIERYTEREMRKVKEIKMATLHSRFFIYLVGSDTVNSQSHTELIHKNWYRSIGIILSHKPLHHISTGRRRRLRRTRRGAQADTVVRVGRVPEAVAGRVPLASARRDAEVSAVAVALERRAAAYGGALIFRCCALATCRTHDASSSNETYYTHFSLYWFEEIKQCKYVENCSYMTSFVRTDCQE